MLASDQLASEIATFGGRRPPLFWLGMHDNRPNDPDHAPVSWTDSYPDNTH